MAASARPMASVVLPEPPFWVASTIVFIEGPLDGFSGRSVVTPHQSQSRSAIAEPSSLRPASPIQRFFEDRGRPNQYRAMMPDNKIVAIPYDYWRNSP